MYVWMVMFVFHIINYVAEFLCAESNRIHSFYTLTHTSTKFSFINEYKQYYMVEFYAQMPIVASCPPVKED